MRRGRRAGWRAERADSILSPVAVSTAGSAMRVRRRRVDQIPSESRERGDADRLAIRRADDAELTSATQPAAGRARSCDARRARRRSQMGHRAAAGIARLTITVGTRECRRDQRAAARPFAFRERQLLRQQRHPVNRGASSIAQPRARVSAACSATSAISRSAASGRGTRASCSRIRRCSSCSPSSASATVATGRRRGEQPQGVPGRRRIDDDEIVGAGAASSDRRGGRSRACRSARRRRESTSREARPRLPDRATCRARGCRRADAGVRRASARTRAARRARRPSRRRTPRDRKTDASDNAHAERVAERVRRIGGDNEHPGAVRCGGHGARRRARGLPDAAFSAEEDESGAGG